MTILVMLISTCNTMIADHIVTFFMRPYPHLEKTEKAISKEYAAKKSAKLKMAGKIAKYTLRSILESNTAAGIFCTYSGQLAISNPDGQVTFARRQQDKAVKLLVTKKINPILMEKQTIHHWEFELDADAALYLVEQKEDQETSVQFWDIEKLPIPEDNNISLDTIVIFAKPSAIFVPEGIIPTEHGMQLILPDIYVKKNVDKLSSSLYVLNLKRFFNFTKRRYKTKEKQFSIQIHG